MIDAHVHLWMLGANGCTWPTPDLAPIHRDRTLADWQALAGRARAVLVQSQEDAADTAWLLAQAAMAPAVAGVVGWCDLLAPGAAGRIEALAGHAKLVGLRPMVQDRAAGWLDDPALDPALTAMAAAGLVLDALVRPRHLAALTRLARRHPRLAIVLDHGGKPEAADLSDWAAAIEALAGERNCWCKLSGLVTEVGDGDVLSAVTDTLWAAFGPTRLLWGSDWPPVDLATGYAGWLAASRSLVPAAHHAAVFGGNAAQVYGLAP